MDISVKKPWDALALDTLSFLPRSENGYRFILAVVDVASRWLELCPLRSKDPLELAFVLEQNVFLSFGPPSSILLPHDKTEYVGPFLKILRKYDVNKQSMAGANPQLVTTIHRCLKAAKRSMQKMMREYPSVPWDHLLKHVSYKFRINRHSNMKASPQKMVLAFKQEPIDKMDYEKSNTAVASDTIRAQRDCKMALAQEKDWFQSNLERFGGLSLSLKAEALRSKMLMDPSESEDWRSFKTPTKRLPERMLNAFPIEDDIFFE